ncbi:MAG: type II toxin-antitoxin system VapC family toxin [Planctomycetota bacterium]|jgi:hypothetical protein
MKPKVYIETTVISYLTARKSPDLVVAGHQQTTQHWWATVRHRCEIFASQFVAEEAAGGDPEMAERRIEALSGLVLVETTPEAIDLAEALIEGGAIPPSFGEDAVHVAIAVVNGADYLITWNCKHIANAAIRRRIEVICRSQGYEPTILCTPEELLDV